MTEDKQMRATCTRCGGGGVRENPDPEDAMRVSHDVCYHCYGTGWCDVRCEECGEPDEDDTAPRG